MYDTPLEDSWQARLLAEEKAAKEFTNIKEKYVIDGNIDYPEPDYLISIGDVPTLPKGNLVAVSAKWKNGKTFFCDILSAIFLGSDVFPNCENLIKHGKVRFIDTEQARNDSARILKTIQAIIPEDRHGDIEVSCLRDADIDSVDADDNDVSRYEFVRRSIEIERPDMVIVDGIADLIYNYNDVNESQDIVHKLAALANKHNCCIVVVMHQNKGSHDKMMKGHIGTMLYQKCSDVFQVEKHGEIFLVTHPVSRHRQSNGLVFKLDENAIPKDGAADRQRQMQCERQQSEQQTREILATVIPDDGTPIKRSDIVEQLTEKHPFQRTRCYELIKQALATGWLEEVDRTRVRLKRAAADVSSVRPL
jgi:hypothetical protein